MKSVEESQFPWLELALAVCVMVLVVLLFPILPTLLLALDFRKWDWTVWTGINIVVLLSLIVVRAWRNR